MLLYPLFIVVMSLAGTIVLVAKGIPAFSSSLALSPQFTHGLVMNAVKSFVLLLFLSFLLVLALYRIFGSESVYYRIFFFLHLLSSASVPLGKAIGSCIAALDDRKAQKALLEVKDCIADGLGVSSSFAKPGFFPPLCVSWIATAEFQGRADSVFYDIASFYAQKDALFKERAEKLAEPVSILITAVYLLVLIQGSVLPLITDFGGIL